MSSSEFKLKAMLMTLGKSETLAPEMQAMLACVSGWHGRDLLYLLTINAPKQGKKRKKKKKRICVLGGKAESPQQPEYA